MSTIYIPTSGGYECLEASDILSINRGIWVDGGIDEKMVVRIVSALLHFDKESDEEITMFIHSPGGSISEGLAIYDVMKGIRSPVRTVAVGMAASMGAVLLAAGTKGRRFVFPSSKVMIHQPLISHVQNTNVSELIELGEHMKDIKQMMNQILADCTGHSAEEIDEACRTDHYFTAKEAVEYGLVDGIMDSANCYM